MGHYLIRQSGGEKQHHFAATWRRVRWFSVCLFLLVAACTPSTVFAVAWSPDGRRSDEHTHHWGKEEQYGRDHS